MTPEARIETAMRGGRPDRPPFSFWYHFGQQHRPPKVVADLHVAFQRRYGMDLLKVMNDYYYPPPRGREAVAVPRDLDRFRTLRIAGSPLALELAALKAIRRGVPRSVPVADTVFTPWTAIRRWAGRRRMRAFARTAPERLARALSAVGETLAAYVGELARAGLWGVFYSTVPAPETSTAAEFRRLLFPVDRGILEAARGAGLRIVLHLHGRPLFFEDALRLPHDLVSWSAGGDNATLRAGRRRGLAVAGGIDEARFSEKTPAEVIEEVRGALHETGGVGHLLAPGCAVPTQVPPRLLDAVREAALGRGGIP